MTKLLCCVQIAGKVVVKVVATDDDDRYKRAKREMNLFKMFYKHKRICHLVNGIALDATKRCICILQYHELGTVQTFLDAGDAKFTKRADSAPSLCLRFKYVVAMAKDVLEGLECMHQMKIVHRDIKPGNICVEVGPSATEFRFTIIDLGAAVSMKTTTDESRSEFSPAPSPLAGFTGQFTSMAGLKLPLGTVPFMSPEHIDVRFVVGRGCRCRYRSSSSSSSSSSSRYRSSSSSSNSDSNSNSNCVSTTQCSCSNGCGSTHCSCSFGDINDSSSSSGASNSGLCGGILTVFVTITNQTSKALQDSRWSFRRLQPRGHDVQVPVRSLPVRTARCPF